MRTSLLLCIALVALSGCTTPARSDDFVGLDNMEEAAAALRMSQGTVLMDDLYLRGCTPVASPGLGSYANPVIDAGYRFNDTSLRLQFDWDSTPNQWVAAELFTSDPASPFATYWGNPSIDVKFDEDALHDMPNGFKVILRGHAGSCPTGEPATASTANGLAIHYTLSWNA